MSPDVLIGPEPPVTRAKPGRPMLRRVVAGVLLLSLALASFVAISIVGAWSTPGNEDFSAKWADWLRSHDAAFVVNPVEQWYYVHNAPRAGGRPGRLNPVPVTATSIRPVAARRNHLRPPAPVGLLVSPALPGEGSWRPTGPAVDGAPGMYVAQFRADTTYTSQITSAVWIDPTRLRIELVPGSREPGGAWPTPPFISGPDLGRAVAAFNGGFRLQDAHGGFYLNGQVAAPLRVGAASVALYRDGRVDVGLWGRDLTMTPDVRAVMQNLVLLVDHGRLDPSASYGDTKLWGHTLGANTVVARSGLGVTASGAIVYVAGPALTARSLAESLQRAGAVRAMALDLNPEWVTFDFFSHPDPANPDVITGAKLYPQIQRSERRYLPPVHESRDFFAVIGR